MEGLHPKEDVQTPLEKEGSASSALPSNILERAAIAPSLISLPESLYAEREKASLSELDHRIVKLLSKKGFLGPIIQNLIEAIPRALSRHLLNGEGGIEALIASMMNEIPEYSSLSCGEKITKISSMLIAFCLEYPVMEEMSEDQLKCFFENSKAFEEEMALHPHLSLSRDFNIIQLYQIVKEGLKGIEEPKFIQNFPCLTLEFRFKECLDAVRERLRPPFDPLLLASELLDRILDPYYSSQIAWILHNQPYIKAIHQQAANIDTDCNGGCCFGNTAFRTIQLLEDPFCPAEEVKLGSCLQSRMIQAHIALLHSKLKYSQEVPNQKIYKHELKKMGLKLTHEQRYAHTESEFKEEICAGKLREGISILYLYGKKYSHCFNFQIDKEKCLYRFWDDNYGAFEYPTEEEFIENFSDFIITMYPSINSVIIEQHEKRIRS